MSRSFISQEEALNRYGDVPLKFRSYYKYSFSFVGEISDGTRIKMTIFGKDEIKNLEVAPDKEFCLKDATWYQIVAKDGSTIAEYLVKS